MVFKTLILLSLFGITFLEASTVTLTNNYPKDLRIKLIGTIDWVDLYVRPNRSVTVEYEGQIVWVEFLNTVHAGHGQGNAVYIIQHDLTIDIKRLPDLG